MCPIVLTNSVIRTASTYGYGLEVLLWCKQFIIVVSYVNKKNNDWDTLKPKEQYSDRTKNTKPPNANLSDDQGT